MVGNDDVGEEFGYKVHVIYGCLASPSEKSRATVSPDSNDAPMFSWDFDSTPVSVTGLRPTSKITFDSTVLTLAQMTALEDQLYGEDLVAGELLLPDALIALVVAAV